jgi:hypothetical protein
VFSFEKQNVGNGRERLMTPSLPSPQGTLPQAIDRGDVQAAHAVIKI